jgi:drug/metabolite transporter (DMT)-like permease
MTTVALTVLAFAIPLGIYLLSRPRRSSREAQVRSAMVLLAAALVWAGALNTHPKIWALIMYLIVGVGFVVLAVRLLVKNRRNYGTAADLGPTPPQSPPR